MHLAALTTQKVLLRTTVPDHSKMTRFCNSKGKTVMGEWGKNTINDWFNLIVIIHLIYFYISS